MSAEVQPRRRRDKRKKKALLHDEYDEGAALYSQNLEPEEDEEVEALRRESNSSDEEYDENDKTGQSVGYKIIFFILLIVMGAVATLVLVENNNRDNPLDMVSNLDKGSGNEIFPEEQTPNFDSSPEASLSNGHNEQEQEEMSSTSFLDNINDIFNALFEATENGPEEHDHIEEQLEKPDTESDHDDDDQDVGETISDFFSPVHENYAEEVSHVEEEESPIYSSTNFVDPMDQIEEPTIKSSANPETDERFVHGDDNYVQESTPVDAMPEFKPIDTTGNNREDSYEPDLDELVPPTNQEFGSDVNIAEEDELFNRDFL